MHQSHLGLALLPRQNERPSLFPMSLGLDYNSAYSVSANEANILILNANAVASLNPNVNVNAFERADLGLGPLRNHQPGFYGTNVAFVNTDAAALGQLHDARHITAQSYAQPPVFVHSAAQFLPGTSSLRPPPYPPQLPHALPAAAAGLSATTKKEYIDYLLAMAHQRYNASDFQASFTVLQDLLSMHPTSIPILLLLGCTCYSLGIYNMSIMYNKTILQAYPNFAEAYSNLGTTYRALGGPQNFGLAEKYYKNALTLRPNYWDAGVNLAGLLSSQSRFAEALDLYRSLQVVFGETWINQENLGLTDQETASLLIEAEAARRIQQTTPVKDSLNADRRRDLYYAKGNLYYALADTEKAKREYFKALIVVNVDLVKIFNITPDGNQLPSQIISPQQAGYVLSTSQQTPSLEPLHHPTVSSVLQSLAKIYQDTHRPHLAVLMYYTSLSILPTANTCNNLGILLAPQRLAESVHWYEFGLSLDPTHVHLFTNLGSALKDRGQVNEGIQCYQRAIALQPDFYIALANLANVYKDLGKVEESILLYRRALRVRPDFIEAFCNYVNSLLFVCQWDERDESLSKIRTVVETQLEETKSQTPRGVPTVLPFHTFTYSTLSARMVREISRRNAERVLWNVVTSDWFPGFPVRPLKLLNHSATTRNQQPQQVLSILERSLNYPYPYPLPPPPTPQIKIGYVSSDFNNHPLAHLMQSVFGMHNREKFQVYCYALTVSDNSPYRLKIQAESDMFLDVSSWNVKDIVNRIALVDGIHILVNLNGYTKGGRNEIFAARPAPISMMFMGFAGTMGSGRADDEPDEVEDGWEGVDAAEDQLHGNQTPTIFENTKFFDEMGRRWMDYFVVDDVACPQKFVCGEPLSPSQTEPAGAESLTQSLLSGPHSNQYLCRGPITNDSDANRIYTERLIYMPHSYFCNDHRQGFRDHTDLEVDDLISSVDPTAESRCIVIVDNDDDDADDADHDEEELTDLERRKWRKEQIRRLKMRQELFPGIKEDTVIFANFNQLYKIDPEIFQTWLKILHRVPNSILWLLRFPPAGEQHLRTYAKQFIGEEISNRVIFTDVAPKDLHIHRGRIADLFLDTPECNAHTTSADILWSGTPLITYPKYDFKMCSRVAASVAYATGSWTGKEVNECAFVGEYPEGTGSRIMNQKDLLGHWMVVGSYKDYEDRAVELASGMTWAWRPICNWKTAPVGNRGTNANVVMVETLNGAVGSNGHHCDGVGVTGNEAMVAMQFQQMVMGPAGPIPLAQSIHNVPVAAPPYHMQYSPYTLTQPVAQPYVPFLLSMPSQPLLATYPYFSLLPNGLSSIYNSASNNGYHPYQAIPPPTLQNTKDFIASLPKGNVTSPFYSVKTKSFHMPSQGTTTTNNNAAYGLQNVTHIFTAQTNSKSILLKMRRRLFLTRDSMPLFDTDRWVRNLETGMVEAWRRWEVEWNETKLRNLRECGRVRQGFEGVGMRGDGREIGIGSGAGFGEVEERIETDSSRSLQRRRRRTTSRCIWICEDEPFDDDNRV